MYENNFLAMDFRPIAHFAGWNSLQRLMNTGILSDSNVSAPKLTFKNAQ